MFLYIYISYLCHSINTLLLLLLTMGKTKLKSSIRALQVAISSLRPDGPVCVQLAKTDSFRAAASSVYSPFTSSSSSPSCNNSNTTCSAFIVDCDDLETVPRGPIASGRFFFSPSTSRCIMEELTDKLVTGFSGNSVQMALCSHDPYSDFRYYICIYIIHKNSFHKNSFLYCIKLF